MNENHTAFIKQSVENQQESNELIKNLFDVAKGDAVVSHPVTEQGHTVVIASELMVGMGAGYGSGQSNNDAGSGGGGGGFSMGRPVALIKIGPNGVTAESLFDVTKVGIATIATLGAMVVSWHRLRQALKK